MTENERVRLDQAEARLAELADAAEDCARRLDNISRYYAHVAPAHSLGTIVDALRSAAHKARS